MIELQASMVAALAIASGLVIYSVRRRQDKYQVLQIEDLPVRRMCCYCLQFFYGSKTAVYCEACEFAVYPDAVVEWEVQVHIDSIEAKK